MRRIHRVPVVTLIMIAANLAAAFAVVLDPDLIAKFGFVASAPSAYAALTSLFLHANLVHLLGNMVFLAAVGPAVEFAARPWRFAVVYFLGGLGGVGLHWLMLRSDPTAAPLIGASAAVAACAAFFSLRYTRLRVPVAPNVGVPVLAVTTVWVVLQVAGAFLPTQPPDSNLVGGRWAGGTAWWAHIGGFVVGLGLALVFRAHRDESVQFGHAVLDQMNERGPAAALAAAELHLRTHADDLRALQEAATAAEQLGDYDRAANHLLNLLELLPESQQAPVLLRLEHLSALERLPSVRRTMLADRVKASSLPAARALLQSVIRHADDPQRPEALLALADLMRESDPEPATAMVQELFEKYPLHPAAEIARRRGWSA
ncbi:MAG: rhomboid family intramembrane serine protease [Fimbriimonadaceae bacterium]